MFTLKFDTDNDAFQNGDREFEIRRILHEVAEKIQYTISYDEEGIIHDINGNKVGSWELK